MKIIGTKVLDEAGRLHPSAKKPLQIWLDLVEEVTWEKPHDIKEQFGTADILKDKRVVFNIKGNDFRLLVKIDYENQVVLVKEFATHKEYNDWKLK